MTKGQDLPPLAEIVLRPINSINSTAAKFFARSCLYKIRMVVHNPNDTVLSLCAKKLLCQ